MLRRLDSWPEVCGGGIKGGHWSFHAFVVELEVGMMVERLVSGMEPPAALARVLHLSPDAQHVRSVCGS
jgi:hypothetical protein